MTIKARYTHEWLNGETKEQLKIEAKSYAEAFRQFWTHFMTTDLIKTIETVDLVGIRTSDSEFFIAVNGQKKKNIQLTPSTWIYTHLTPKAMEKAYEKFLKGWNGEITAPVDDITAMPETDDDLTATHVEIDKQIEEMKAEESQEENLPKPEEKKLTAKEERRLKVAAANEKARQEKAEKKRKAEERKAAKAQKAAESQEQIEAELPNI